MSMMQEDDDEISYELAGGEIHGEWKELWDNSTSGERSWLTKLKKHYARILQNDAEAGAELLAMYEHQFALRKRQGFPDSKGE